MKKIFLKLLGKGQDKKAFIERAARARMLDSHSIYFESLAFPGAKLGVLNISVTGVGLDESSLLKWPDSGGELEGRFHFQRAEVPAKLQIVRKKSGIIGCSFTGELAPIRRAVMDFFNIELEAQKMSEVRVSQFDNITEGSPRWFYSNEGMELYFVEKNSVIINFYLVHGTHYLEGSKDGIRYGHIQGGEERPSGEIRHKQSNLISWQDSVSDETLAMLRRMIKNISLSLNMLNQIETFIKSGVKA